MSWRHGAWCEDPVVAGAGRSAAGRSGSRRRREPVGREVLAQHTLLRRSTSPGAIELVCAFGDLERSSLATEGGLLSLEPGQCLAELVVLIVRPIVVHDIEVCIHGLHGQKTA